MDEAFTAAKSALLSPNSYDTTLPICLAGDTSAYGIGAVISQMEVSSQ